MIGELRKCLLCIITAEDVNKYFTTENNKCARTLTKNVQQSDCKVCEKMYFLKQIEILKRKGCGKSQGLEFPTERRNNVTSPDHFPLPAQASN